MAEERLKVPSARIAVSLLDDEDTLSLFQRGKDGFVALWAFTGLLIVAKAMHNRGVFTGTPAKYARKLGMSPAQLETAMKTIAEACAENGNEPWIVREKDSFRIRKWERWNAGNWGGPRDGAGRKSESSGNQDGIKMIDLDYSRSHLPSSVSSSGAGTGKDPVQPEPAARNSHPVLPSARAVRLAGQESRGEGSGWTGHDEPPTAPPIVEAVRLRIDHDDDPTAKHRDDDIRRQYLAEFLADIGIGPPTDSELIELGCTVEQAERTWAAVQADAGAVDKPGAFVFRMRRDFGRGGRKDTLPRADADGVTRLERIGRNKQAGAQR